MGSDGKYFIMTNATLLYRYYKTEPP